MGYQHKERHDKLNGTKQSDIHENVKYFSHSDNTTTLLTEDKSMKRYLFYIKYFVINIQCKMIIS